MEAVRAWNITSRWVQYRSEGRINTFRLIAISVFYGIHLLHYLQSHNRLPGWGTLGLGDIGTPLTPKFHFYITLLAFAWLALALIVHLFLIQPCFPVWFSSIVTAGDTLLLTGVLLMTSGPASPLIAVYFLLIAFSTLRYDLNNVRLTTTGVLLAYLVLLGAARWPEIFRTAPTVDTVPRYHQAITLAAFAFAGLAAGQIVRGIPQAAETYRQRLESEATL